MQSLPVNYQSGCLDTLPNKSVFPRCESGITPGGCPHYATRNLAKLRGYKSGCCMKSISQIYLRHVGPVRYKLRWRGKTIAGHGEHPSPPSRLSALRPESSRDEFEWPSPFRAPHSLPWPPPSPIHIKILCWLGSVHQWG